MKAPLNPSQHNAPSCWLILHWFETNNVFAEPPDTSASEYELLMTSPDRQTAAEVYRGPKTEASVTDLLPGRAYTFQVRALNHAGVS